MVAYRFQIESTLTQCSVIGTYLPRFQLLKIDLFSCRLEKIVEKTRIQFASICLAVCGLPVLSYAQTVQPPSTINTPAITAYQNPGAVAPTPIGAAPSGLGGTIGAWDPYSSSASNIYAPPSLPPASYPGTYPPPTSYPPASTGFGTGPPAYYPQQPPPLYTQPPPPYSQPYGNTGLPKFPYERFLENVSFRFTWLPKLDTDPDALQTHDFDFSTTALFPNFLHTDAPLRVTPAFVLHLWDGPSNGVQDLPANAYSAYVDGSWDPHLSPRLWAELGLRIGAYSDFNTITSRSVRYQGLAVANVALTPTATLKGGVVYLDRMTTKLLPVVGVLWQPNKHSRYDITFPYPRLSRYWGTFGNRDVWWYVGGEYGGGSWTIKRYDFMAMDEVGDRIDINDYRVFFGMESTQVNQSVAFFEIGYVWSRKIIYESTLADLDLDATLMLRSGFKF